MKMSVLSTQFFPVAIEATLNGAPHDPTADVVEFSFAASGVEPTVWSAGIWEPSTGGPTYTAKILVGPDGGQELPVGSYTGWIRITDDPERPVLQVGNLTITEP